VELASAQLEPQVAVAQQPQQALQAWPGALLLKMQPQEAPQQAALRRKRQMVRRVSPRAWRQAAAFPLRRWAWNQGLSGPQTTRTAHQTQSVVSNTRPIAAQPIPPLSTTLQIAISVRVRYRSGNCAKDSPPTRFLVYYLAAGYSKHRR
jgi:hypothetical protein